MSKRDYSAYRRTTYKYIFIIASIVLVTLPFVTTFNSLLTSLFDRIGLYKLIEYYIVPWQASMITGSLRLFGISIWTIKPFVESMAFYMVRGSEKLVIDLQWNCLGWQSMIFFLLSLLVGWQGEFSQWSKLQSFLIGFSGTILVNLFRVILIVLLSYYWSELAAMIVHDYFAALMSIVWLFVFWWFSYSFVLE